MSQVIERVWAGAGNTNAPTATKLAAGMLGAENGGIAEAPTWYVVNGTWVLTGGKVKHIFGVAAV